MGAQCPKCQTWQPIKQVLTADGSPPVKGDDVVIQVLGCGHTFGKQEFTEYQKAVNEIALDFHKDVQDLKANRDKQLAARWEEMQTKLKGERA